MCVCVCVGGGGGGGGLVGLLTSHLAPVGGASCLFYKSPVLVNEVF